MKLPDPYDVVTLHNLGLFIGGMLFERGYMWINDKYQDHKDPDNAPHKTQWRSVVLAWAVGIFVFLYIALTTAQTHAMTVAQAEEAKQQAADTKKCLSSLQSALLADRALQTQMNDLAKQQRQAQDEWLQLLTAPPKEMFDLHTTDPKFQDWAIGINNTYKARLDDINARYDSVFNQLIEHPLPEPGCGS
jgi:hypothetical protein